MPFEILHVTAQYSNAVLVAVMPYISDFAKKMDLPIPQPVTMAQVSHFGCSSRSDHVGGRVVLTNGCSFVFDRGAVVLFESPHSYYSLQDPDRIPEFYGEVKISKSQAVKIAHAVIKKLGYADATFYADRSPIITSPPRFRKHQIARYRVEWTDFFHDPIPGIPPPHSIDMEINAATGQIEMLYLSWRDVQRPDPQINVRAPVTAPQPKPEPVGGTRIIYFNAANSNAFLVAILPQLSDFVKKAGVDVKIPITINDVDKPDYVCGLLGDDPMACVYLKTGDRFWYEHGQVTAFESRNSVRWSAPNRPIEDKPREEFYGPVNMTTNEAIFSAKKVLTNLGYSLETPAFKKPLRVAPPTRDGTNYFARIFVSWWDSETETDVAEVEFDATTKQLKSFAINDDLMPNIWREPPKINP